MLPYFTALADATSAGLATKVNTELTRIAALDNYAITSVQCEYEVDTPSFHAYIFYSSTDQS